MHVSAIFMRVVIVSVAAVALGFATAAAQQQPADLIVTNAKVTTVDTQRPQATAFAVKATSSLSSATTPRWHGIAAKRRV